MRQLNLNECEHVSGGNWVVKAIAVYDAVRDGISGFVDGAKAGYGLEEGSGDGEKLQKQGKA